MMRYHFCRLPGFMAYPGGWQMTHFRFDGLVFGCCLKLGEPFLAAQDPQKDKYLAPLAFICSLFIFLYISLNFNYQNWYHYTLAYVATGLLFAAALRGLYLLKIVAENRFLIWIGKNSYGMYLWHLIILFPFRRVYFYTDGSRPLIIGLYIITVILIGALSTGTIERYFLSVRKRLAP